MDEKVLHCHLEQKKGKYRNMSGEKSCFGSEKLINKTLNKIKREKHSEPHQPGNPQEQ